MNKEALEDVANGVSANAAKISKNENFSSVILTIMIIGIIVNLVRVAQECDKDKTKNLSESSKNEYYANRIISLCDRRSWLTKMRIKKIIREKIGYKEYKEHGGVLVESILDSGSEIQKEKLIKLLEEVNV